MCALVASKVRRHLLDSDGGFSKSLQNFSQHFCGVVVFFVVHMFEDDIAEVSWSARHKPVLCKQAVMC